MKTSALRRTGLAALRNSQGVGQVRTGTALMLRRGLHGAKTWVFERNAEGNHYGVMARMGKVFVVLLPAVYAVSSLASTPVQGEKQPSAFGVIIGALLFAFVELAVFSARERRAGRETPWDAPPVVAESEKADEAIPTEEFPEEPPTSPAFPQVSEEAAESTAATGGDLSDFSDLSPQKAPILLPTPVHPPDIESPPALAAEGIGASPVVLRTPLQSLSPPRTNQEKVDPPVHGVVPAFPDVLHAAINDPPFPQMGAVIETAQPAPGDEITIPPKAAISDGTESEGGAAVRESSVSLHKPLRTSLREPAPEGVSALVNQLDAVLPQQVQEGLRHASPGPYPITAHFLSEDWWQTKPDAISERPPVSPPPETEADIAPVPPEVPPEEPAWRGPLPEIALLFIASRNKAAAFTPDQRESARVGAVQWAHAEVSSGHRSQADVARIFAVDRSTVMRWLSDDPWAE